jgi:hypothetical protein
VKILHRLRLAGEVVSIIENEHSIEIETHGPNGKNPKLKAWVENYLEAEGIMEAVLSGNTKFAEPIPLDAQDIIELKNRQKGEEKE